MASWRVGTLVVVLACGGLFVLSAQSSGGTDLRPGRYDDLAALTGKEADSAAVLQARVADLQSRVDSLTSGIDDDAVQRIQKRVATLESPAGLTATHGQGIEVTLSDSPQDLRDTYPGEQRDLVVHQQDIQAVVNAMWDGGARAVLIAGQRVVTTTGIKCEGNSVLLQGQPYPQPFVIEAVGDVGRLSSAIAADDYLEAYRALSDDPGVAIGWDLEIESEITAPAYDGLLDLTYATPIDDTGRQSEQQDS